MELKFKYIYILWAVVILVDQANATFRIVGGVSLSDNEYLPYQVSFQDVVNSQVEHFCGGSIITPRSILTAAHCLKSRNPDDLYVVAGIRDLNDTSGGQRVRVAGYEMHSKYKEFYGNDIAIVYVDPPFVLDGVRVDKIDASSKKRISGNVRLMLSGWGALTADGEEFPMRLQKLSYRTIKNDECHRYVKNLTNNELCAIVRAKGSCLGDSGGPLVLKANGHFHLVGLVSYGTKICASQSPDVYTRISAYVDWIRKRLV